MKKVLFAFAALIALTSGRACSRSAKLKQVWLCSCLLAALAACGNKQAAAPETESSEVTNEVVTNDTISKEMKEANMQEVQAYLKECGAFFIATADGDQPHVRPFGVSEIIDGRLYIMTGKVSIARIAAKLIFLALCSSAAFSSSETSFASTALRERVG